MQNNYISNYVSSNHVFVLENISIDEFYKKTLCGLSESYNKENLIKLIKDKISIIKHHNDKNNKLSEFFKMHNVLEKFTNKLENVCQLSENDKREILINYIDLKNIIVDQDGENVKVIYNSSINESLLKSIDDLFLEILLYFIFNTDVKVECNRENFYLKESYVI